VIYGGAGDDWAWGRLGDDFIYGGSGGTSSSETEANTVVGGDKSDLVAAGGARRSISRTESDDYLTGARERHAVRKRR
jgi:Ca2+-binding RTX toxin-like protein